MVNKKNSSGKTTLYHTGYFESEGIRVTDGVVYINLTARMKNTKGEVSWKHFVFKYDLTK